MMTRSIVGRFLILAVLLLSLGVIAQAALIITRGSNKAVAKVGPAPLAAPAAALAAAMPATAPATMPAAASTSQVAAVPAAVPAPGAGQAAAQGAGQPADAAPVRVVYPGPLGDAAVPPRKFAAAASTASAAAQPAPAAVQAASQPVAPAAQVPAPAAPSPAVQAAAPAPARPSPVMVASADADTQPAADPAAATPGTPATRGGVNLNSASVDALNRLGGGHIGQTIVKHRPYGSVEDLMKKRVIRRSVYEQIKNQVAAQ